MWIFVCTEVVVHKKILLINDRLFKNTMFQILIDYIIKSHMTVKTKAVLVCISQVFLKYIT